mgnify:CR=1 FL=1
MPDFDRIYLTGFMGSGKSTVTPRLALCLAYTHVDLDEEVTSWLGMSVSGIFAVLGEHRFRKAEQEILRKHSQRSRIVVSLGGGTIMQEGNLEYCQSQGVIVYLRATPEFLAKRLSRSRQPRPLLFDEQESMLQGEALLARVRSLLSERKDIYEKAHLVVDIDGKEPSTVASDIQKGLGAMGMVIS